mmetsp:Transcript_14007/g.19158  ORF Transcript_14007/g.19158 Transcript_14007/m.19158 type:complete len:391 (-) Transcript_14007:148-1320(-)
MSLTMNRNAAKVVTQKQNHLSLIMRRCLHQKILAKSPSSCRTYQSSSSCRYKNTIIHQRTFQSLAAATTTTTQWQSFFPTSSSSNTFQSSPHRFLHTPSPPDNSEKEEEVLLRINPPCPPNDDDNDEAKDTTTTNTTEGVAILTLNRPKAANAMGTTMLTQLHHALFTTLTNASPSDVRCIVLTSSSPKIFSAGADLKERSKMTQEEAAAFVTKLRGTFDGLEVLEVPVIAAVEGVALGGGLEIALTADIVVAGKNAKFGLPETGLAIIPGAGGTQRLPRKVGAARAKDLIYTGRRIDADTAYEYGLVQHVVDAGSAEEKALDLAQQIAQKGPLAIRAAKTAINQGFDAPNIKAAMEVERQCYQKVIPTSDRLEGLAAFREGRKPVYKGE